MIENEIIPFEVAVALKFLGFNEPCHYLYNTTDDNPKPFPCDVSGLSQDWNSLYVGETNKHLISAPSREQGFLWLKNNYNF